MDARKVVEMHRELGFYERALSCGRLSLVPGLLVARAMPVKLPAADPPL